MNAEELSNMDIAVYVLYQLGGAEDYVHTEDVALECFRLFPSKFSWDKYPKYPDAEPARSGLFDASKAKYGRLTTGNKPAGWLLTPPGVNRARELGPRIEELLAGGVRVRSVRQQEDRLLNALEKHPALQKFEETGTCEGIAAHEVASFLQCSLDSGAETFSRRADRVRSRAYDKGRTVVVAFIEACEREFPTLFGVQLGGGHHVEG